MPKKIGLPLIALIVILSIVFTVDDATGIGELIDVLEFAGLGLGSAYVARSKR